MSEEDLLLLEGKHNAYLHDRYKDDPVLGQVAFGIWMTRFFRKKQQVDAQLDLPFVPKQFVDNFPDDTVEAALKEIMGSHFVLRELEARLDAAEASSGAIVEALTLVSQRTAAPRYAFWRDLGWGVLVSVFATILVPVILITVWYVVAANGYTGVAPHDFLKAVQDAL